MGSIRCVTDRPVQTGAEATNEAEAYLASRVAVHADLVDAIVAGDVEGMSEDEAPAEDVLVR